MSHAHAACSYLQTRESYNSLYPNCLAYEKRRRGWMHCLVDLCVCVCMCVYTCCALMMLHGVLYYILCTSNMELDLYACWRVCHMSQYEHTTLMCAWYYIIEKM